MSNTFASLMALSATQTKEQESAVESALRERQRKEALRRKQQEEKEAKDREMEKQRRIRMFEDQKREEERRKRQEEAKKAQELAFKRREEEEKNRLLYGPKKAAKLASSSSPSSDHKNKGRRRSPDDLDDGGPIPLTREELRERKQKMEMNRLYGSASKKGSSSHGGTHRAGRRLPGGAVDITTSSTSASQGSSGDHRSVRDRLAALPNTLVKLNQNKRDTRTIDEILQDRQKAKEAKTLEGDQALGFDDWFGTKKDREKEKEVKPTASRMSSAAPSSGANTPSHFATTSQLASSQKKTAAPSKALPSFRPTATSKATPNGASQPRGPVAGPSRADRLPDKMKSLGLSKSSKSSHSDHHSSSKLSSSTSSKKRARSISRSESPPPKRKHRPFADDDELDVSAEIWKMFGKNRNTYVSRDVMSDDEDMEADAGSLEQEELRSYRIAQREEQAALEEERRHEEEKRRRKKIASRGA